MDHHFQVNLRGIIDLLSNHLYSGPEVFLRELLQNAVDAVRARLAFDPAAGGEISIELVRARGEAPAALIVSDDGVGLTEDEVHRFLATIGESSKRGLAGDRPTDFLGRFGIGLLSCFMVSDEIVVVARSAKSDAPPVEWRGRADGGYTVKTLQADLAPGAQVYLTCKPGAEDLYQPDRILELARRFGGLLPYPIRFNSGKGTVVVNAEPPPWRRRFASERERTRALLDYGREAFGESFFDAVPLDLPEAGLDGVAFVLAVSPSPTSKQAHRVYLKDMFLAEGVETLLPPWAFFVKLIVNSETLRPTASREGFQDDALLRAAREAVGRRLRDYLVELSQEAPQRLLQLIALHDLTIKALALADDDFYRIVFDWLPVETTEGDMTLGECRRRHDVLRYTPSIAQFQQIAQVAAAQKMCIINAGYVHLTELLEKYGGVFDEGRVERVEGRDVVERFRDLSEAEEAAAEGFLRQADQALRPHRCFAELKKFSPAELPALYTTSEEGRLSRSIEQSKDVAAPLWSSMLEKIAPRTPAGGGFARLSFNYDNRMVRKVLRLKHAELLKRSVEMLYVQALLLGRHPLTAKETALLNEGLPSLLDFALDAAGGE